MKGGQLVVDCLKRQHVQFVFGLADTLILDILDAIHDEPSIRYISVRHEQVASMMADGYARTAGRPGVCISQSGAGSMNMLYGIASAFKDSVPLVAITGHIDANLMGRDAWHDLDMKALYAPVTKWSTLVTDVRDIQATLDHAFHLAQSGRPGPVHVNITADTLAAEIAAPEAGAATLAVQLKPSSPLGTDVDRAIRALADAERPVIFAGGGVIWSKATDALIKFSERSGIPVIVTDTARGAIPEAHPHALGPAGFFGSKAASQALREADAIFGVGTRFPNLNTNNWKLINPSATVVQNNIDSREIGRQVHAAIGIVADARQCLEAMLAAWEVFKPRIHKDRADRIIALKQAVESEREAALTPPPGTHERIPIEAVVREISAVLGSETTVAIDSGMHVFASSRLPVDRPGSFLTSAGLGAMGYALPGAMGAKLARPGAPAVALVGDGGFQMISQDLETAVRCDIPVVVVVYNNNAFGAQRIRQRRDYGGRLFGTVHGNPDFSELAKLYGAEGRSVRTIGEFRPALEALLASGRVGVIDVHID